jgi:hypothetical protein
MKIKRHVKFRRDSCFGEYADIKTEHSAMIVMANDGYGLKPLSVLLPHQLYLKDIKEMLKIHNQIWVVPVDSAKYQKVAEKK